MNQSPDRDALARRLLDVVAPPCFSLSDRVDSYLTMIEGVAGYLCMTCAEAKGNAIPASCDEVSAVGDAIMKAAQIARVLGEAVAQGPGAGGAA